MNTQQDELRVRPKIRRDVCPSCGQVGMFTYLGEQQWPPRVVEVTGIGPVVDVWRCSQCHTTLTRTAVDSRG